MSKIAAVPEDLYNKAAEIAAEDHVPVDEFVSAAVANPLAGWDCIRSLASLFDGQEFERRRRKSRMWIRGLTIGSPRSKILSR